MEVNQAENVPDQRNCDVGISFISIVCGAGLKDNKLVLLGSHHMKLHADS